MAKKDKKGEGAVQNREIFQRMNFLYQAAMCMATITAPLQPKPNTNSNSGSNTNNPESAAKDTSGQTDIASKTGPESSITGTGLSTDVDMADSARHAEATLLTKSTAAATSEARHPSKLSRRKKKEFLRQRKTRVAMEQISADKAHHSLTTTNGNRDLHPLSGTARFYASTLREVGRKNVIRIGPAIKRSICLRCEAILIPSISCEVRIQALPQLHTAVTCTACGAFRRYFCMAGKGIEDDRWEPEVEATEVEATASTTAAAADEMSTESGAGPVEVEQGRSIGEEMENGSDA
ncbi:hypothetical protein EDD21DRAFT_381920 [Dissophora ornata]|nr:hypothetical protein EDD21DRAFT_381920 [Dissophora ornata]